MKRLLKSVALLAAWLTCANAFALPPQYFGGHLYVYERADRFASILGGSVTFLRATGHDEFELPFDALLIEGVISNETVSHVRRITSQRPLTMVYLNSPGGDLLAGIALGHLFREREFTAVVNAGRCKSACALAFLGAPMRILATESTAIGFHRQYRIVQGKMVYGDLREDKMLVDAYLRSVDFSGVSAEEITSTTGDATFSETSLVERGVVSLTRRTLQEKAKTLAAMSGATQFEIVSVVCSKYDNSAKSPAASLEYVMRNIACGGRVPAVREPLLTLAWGSFPVPFEYESTLLSAPDVIQDANVVEAFNRSNEAKPGAYDSYLEKRASIRKAQRAAEQGR